MRKTRLKKEKINIKALENEVEKRSRKSDEYLSIEFIAYCKEKFLTPEDIFYKTSKDFQEKIKLCFIDRKLVKINERRKYQKIKIMEME